MTIKPYYVNLFLSALSLIYKDLISIHSHNSGKRGFNNALTFYKDPVNVQAFAAWKNNKEESLHGATYDNV
jgi:hypothetical protein